MLGTVSTDGITGDELPFVGGAFTWQEDVVFESFYDWTDTAKTDNGQDLGLQRAFATGSAKLYADEQYTFLLNLGADYIDVDQSAPIVFDKTGTEIPDDFSGVDLGFTGRWIDSAERRWVGSVSVESLSNQPYESSDDVVYNLFGSVFLPTGGKQGMDGWILGLNFRSTTDYPLPLAAYAWNPDRSLRTTIGLPFIFVDWKPTEKWRLSFRNFALSPGLEAQYTIQFPFKAFARISSDKWEGFVADRRNDDFVISQEGWRAGGGLEWSVNYSKKIRLEAGWEFDRYLIEQDGSDIFGGGSDEEKIGLDDSVYVRFSLNWSFGGSGGPPPGVGGKQGR